MIGGKRPFDISKLNLFIYDEADEIFNQKANLPTIAKFYEKFAASSVNPQTVLFSATFNEENKKLITGGKIIPGDLK